VCGLSAEKKRQIISVWTLLQEVLKLCQEQQPWLDSQEQILKDIESRREQKSRDEIQNLKVRLEVRYYIASYIIFLHLSSVTVEYSLNCDIFRHVLSYDYFAFCYLCCNVTILGLLQFDRIYV
jgi:hypothetical protein